jgi:DNA-binding transcriptional LysR family regulator
VAQTGPLGETRNSHSSDWRNRSIGRRPISALAVLAKLAQNSAMHDIDTQLLRTFVALAETQSFSRTAARIGRSQSAVSAQIKKLEDMFGRTLIERDTRNVALTGEGEKLLVHAHAMIAAADAMLARFRVNDVAGEVRFGSPEDFASAYLPGILSSFAEAHEHVRLHVTCDFTLRLIAQFEAGEQDLVIVKQDPGALHPGAQPLWREDLVWVGAKADNGDDAAFAGLSEDYRARGRALPLVLSPAPCVYRSRAASALDRAGIPWTCVYQSPSFAGCVAAVQAGLGFTVMPRAMAPSAVSVFGQAQGWPALPAAEICLLGQNRLPAAAQALADFIRERAPKHRGT